MSPTGKAFYVTTPIYYVNDAPHIGHAYTTVAADTICRWHRQRGEDVWLLTGTDEHGEKVLRTARAAGVSPQEWADRLVAEHWKPVLADRSRSPTTTSSAPPSTVTRRRVQAFLTRLKDAGHIYSGDYEGPYCVDCEEFKLPGELHPGDRGVRGPAGLPRPRPPGRDRVGDQLVLPAVRVRRRAAGALRRDTRTPSRRRARTTRSLQFIRTGLQDLSISRSQLRLGDSRAVGRLPGRLRLVRRAAELRHRRRARRQAAAARGGEVRRDLAGGHPPRRQGHPALPRRDLAGDADGGRAAAARGRSSPTAGCWSAARR